MAAQKKKATKVTRKKPLVKKQEDESPLEIVMEVPEEKESVEIVSESISTNVQTDKIESLEVEKEKKEIDLDNGSGDDDSWSTKKILLWIVCLAFVVAVLTFLGIFIYQQGVKSGEEAMQKKIESQTPTETPTPTVENVAKDKYTIKVLNGSGISGEAGRVEKLLTEEGYSVSSIGNASSSGVSETSISTKEGVSDAWLNGFKKFLSKTYAIKEGYQLSEDEKTDVAITVGSKKAE